MKTLKLILNFTFALTAFAAVSQSAHARPRIFCEVGNISAPKGPGFPHEHTRTEASSNIATLKLGDFPEDSLFWRKSTSFFQYGVEFQAPELKLYTARISSRKDIATIKDEEVMAIQKQFPSAIDYQASGEVFEQDKEVYIRVTRRYNPLNENVGLNTVKEDPREVLVKFSNFGKPHILQGIDVAVVCRGRIE